MAKKPLSVTIRKASSAPPSERIDGHLKGKDAFVAGGKPGFRAITLYLPDALADRLTAHCKTNDCDMSALISEALEAHLSSSARVEHATRVVELDDPVTALMKWVHGKLTLLRPAWLF
jgi:hypothetical protein